MPDEEEAKEDGILALQLCEILCSEK